MKVLHVTAGMDPKSGGVCKAVRTLIAGLAGLQVYNEVASLDSPDAAYLASDRFPVNALGPGKGPWCFNRKFVPWLIDNLGRFDVVILHGLWLYPGYGLEKALRIFKAGSEKRGTLQKVPKLFVMPHGMLDPYFQRAKTRKLKAIRNIVYWQLIERKVVNGAEGLLFTCEQERELSQQPFRPYAPKREIVVGLGVEKPPVFDNRMAEAFADKCPRTIDEPYLLFLGRIHEKKGVDLLIQAYKKLFYSASGRINASSDEFAIASENILPKLVIAGPDLHSPYGNEIRLMVESDPLIKNNILFTGMLSGKAKWGAFYGCEAFVLPSHQENFGMAVVEAMACRKPVLISNQVNIFREIENNKAGIVGDNTIEGTAWLLEQWNEMDVSERLVMSENSYATYLKYFTIKAIASRFLTAISASDLYSI